MLVEIRMKRTILPAFGLAALACSLVVPASLAAEGSAAASTNVEPAVLLTPLPPHTPRINGATVFGVRPGNPFLFTIPATGDRPMVYSADGLPAGLKLDTQTGHITGTLANKGEYTVTLGAQNALGKAERKLKIACGDVIGLTPALGWNSWNCFAAAVTAERVKTAADAMVQTNAYGRLIDHGWSYINIDDYWEQHPRNMERDPSLGGPGRDAEGRIVPNPRFPDMKGLVDYIHGLGLKAGIYSSPGPTTCGGCLGSWQHEDQDAQQYADWGIDYLKYDWCSSSQVVPPPPSTNSPAGTNALARGRGRGRQNFDRATLMKPYQVMRTSLDKVHRDILYSLCQYGWGNVWEWGDDSTIQGNSWRTTGDINDSWGSMAGIGFRQAGHEKYAGPGHFNDPDMLVVGRLGWGRLHPSRLTPDEQYTHISLWCLLTSPLLIGCDMSQMDDFTLNLLCNDEVLAVDQDPLGRQASRIVQNADPQTEIWAKPLEDGSKAVGLFNRSEVPTTITLKWDDLNNAPMTDLKVSGKQLVRDLWRQKDIGTSDGQFEVKVPRHGVVLVKLTPAK